MAEAQNFGMTSGDSETITVTVKNAAGAAVDLTGARVKWSARPLNSAAATLEKTSAAGEIEITDPTGGVFVVTLDPIDTADLNGVFLHESEITDVAGNVSTVAQGRLTIFEDVVA